MTISYSYNPGMSMISLLLHESEAKQRMSVNKDIIRMYLGYNLLISQRSTPINASLYNEHINTMASTGCVTYQSFFVQLLI